ncbi:hypothetical protein [Corynebacterium heidelbergense]|nr:hypothetical protein [Corynebacterium heidelbergense]
MDDASLTVARLMCSKGNLNSPDGWAGAISEVDPDQDFVKAVHAKAEEYSR